MKEESSLQAHLLDKFNELPVPANAAAGWNNMEKTLQISMPEGIHGLALYFKVWLSKKIMVLWIAGLSLGTGVTALAVYQSRQASLATETQQPNSPKQKTSPVVADTTIRASKKRKTERAARRNAVPRAATARTVVARDTFRHDRVARTIKDTALRPGSRVLTTARIVRETAMTRPALARTTTVRPVTGVRPARTYTTARGIRDTAVRSTRTYSTARTSTMTRPTRTYLTARPARDTTPMPAQEPRATIPPADNTIQKP